MGTVKKILKSPAAQAFAAFFLSLFIRLVCLTNCKDIHIDPQTAVFVNGDANAIFAFWHGRMMVLPAFYPPGRPIRVLISRHSDGALISRVISHFGHKTVTGSTSKGGLSAANEILEALSNGDNVGITPDGPRGPAAVASRGAVTLARLAKKPLIPVTFAATRAKRLHSWDRFLLVLPFGRIVFCVGAPLAVAETLTDDQEEATRLQFEQTMNALVEKAERLAHG
jgi:lysophospholipid acyltransferase (LPLAT)-like uncharacterized protein